jgi:hypothetical protein
MSGSFEVSPLKESDVQDASRLLMSVFWRHTRPYNGVLCALVGTEPSLEFNYTARLVHPFK